MEISFFSSCGLIIAFLVWPEAEHNRYGGHVFSNKIYFDKKIHFVKLNSLQIYTNFNFLKLTYLNFK